MSYVIVGREWLEIDGVPLSTPAWTTRTLSELWSSPPQRGADRIIPSATGVRTWPWRATIAEFDLELDVVGDTDWEGTPYSDARIGLATNCAHLIEVLIDAPTSTDGLRTAVMHLASGEMRVGELRVSRVRFADLGDWGAAAQISLAIPAGQLVTSA